VLSDDLKIGGVSLLHWEEAPSNLVHALALAFVFLGVSGSR
jgi:hypothetical protein